MFIDCVTNSGKPYLRVAESYSVKENGMRKNRKRTIRNLGPLAKFDDGKPNFLQRLRQSFKDGKPIIEGLEDLIEGKSASRRIVFEINKDDDCECYCNPKNIGYFLLDGLYDALGIYDVLSLYKSRSKIDYDVNGLAKLLVFGRILSPDSKLETFNNKDAYVFDVTSSDHLIEAYRTLDVLDKNACAIQKRMNSKIQSKIGRNTDVCFYDVTNYWFEIAQNDEDILDESGKLKEKGLRKKGVSKENRRNPIVQMGLFIDDNGIPISYKLFPGNATDQTTMIPALEKTIDHMNFGKVIIVADGGLNSGPNIAHILKHNNGYIFSKSTRKCDKNVKAWILDPSDYQWNSARTFKVKSQIRKRKIKNAEGQTIEITEKLVSYWSKKHHDREMRENAKFMEYLESVTKNQDKLKDKPRKIEQFLTKMQVDKSTGEILKTATHLSVNMAKVQEYIDLFGYYTIMTSEVDKSDAEIINKYHGLSRIEDSFRIIKSDLDGRPVYVRTPAHINAHFMLCFIALTMIRLIQYKVLRNTGKEKSDQNEWESGITGERIKKALAGFQADPLPGGYYRVTKPTADMALILRAFGVEGNLKLPTISELRNLKYSFDKAALM